MGQKFLKTLLLALILISTFTFTSIYIFTISSTDLQYSLTSKIPLINIKEDRSTILAEYSGESHSIIDDLNNTVFDNVYLLNREIRVDRLKTMLPMLKHVGIFPKVFTAIDKSLPQFQDSPDNVKGIRACLESHRAILRDVIKNEYKWTLILEDDVNFNVSFKYDLIKYRSLVLDFNSIAQMIYFGGFGDSNAYIERNAIDPKVIRVTKTYGSFAYAVSLDGAKTLLPILEDLTEPVDTFEKSKILAYIVYPLLVTGIHKLGSDLRSQSSVVGTQSDWQPEFKVPVYEIFFGKEEPKRSRFGIDLDVFIRESKAVIEGWRTGN